jgi:hypothetical protein
MALGSSKFAEYLRIILGDIAAFRQPLSEVFDPDRTTTNVTVPVFWLFMIVAAGVVASQT